MELHLAVILGSVREGRRSEHVARFVLKRLQARAGVTGALLDPRELALGDLVTRDTDLAEVPAPRARLVEQATRADGFVIVTPEYNFGIPGALKNLLDATYKPWNRKPFALVGCGGVSGGLRAIDHARQVVTGLGGITVPAHVPVQGVAATFGPDGPFVDAPAWERRVDGLLAELEWYARALKAARSAPV